jgi:secondary thiamine-phosphate synthase enzyme
LPKTIGVNTASRVEFRDITAEVTDVVRASGVESGVCHVYVLHTTAAVTINESADPSVVRDIIAQLDTMAPQHGDYRHMEGNSPAHIKSSLIGSSVTLLVEGGRPVLGTWQGVFFCEFDGPRSRKVLVKVVPDPQDERPKDK